jgi:hypothetical protein
MLNIPEITICSTLNNLLEGFRKNYRDSVTAGQESRSMIYLLFNGLTLGKYSYYENLKKILITTEQDPRHLEVKLAFDSGAVKYPQVYISLPSETDRNNSMGIGQGDQDELTFENQSGLDEYRMQFSRRWATTYNLVVLSDNSSEVIILYHLFKAFMILATTHFVQSGIENLRIGGNDLSIRDGRIPDKLFLKSITMNFEYEQKIPEYLSAEIVQKLQLFWRVKEAEDYNGPVDIQTE